MKNMNKYKIIFLFSLVPYAAFIFMFFIVAVSGFGYHHGKHAYGLAAVENWWWTLDIYWFDLINKIHVTMITCVIYQIVYLLALRNSANKPLKRKIAKVFLWLSFAPYVLLSVISVGFAIFGTREVRFFGGGDMIYGFGAFFQTLFWGALGLIIIPIIPLCIIYQIIYFIVKKRKKNKVFNETDNGEVTEAVSQAAVSESGKIMFIAACAVWGVFCAAQIGLFRLSSDNPYIDPARIQRTADFYFSYSDDYSERDGIPTGATRYIHLNEMRIYWFKNNHFGYNTLYEADEMFMGRNNEYDIILTWEGAGEIKAVYAVGPNGRVSDYSSAAPPVSIHIYVEMNDGRLLSPGVSIPLLY